MRLALVVVLLVACAERSLAGVLVEVLAPADATRRPDQLTVWWSGPSGTVERAVPGRVPDQGDRLVTLFFEVREPLPGERRLLVRGMLGGAAVAIGAVRIPWTAGRVEATVTLSPELPDSDGDGLPDAIDDDCNRSGGCGPLPDAGLPPDAGSDSIAAPDRDMPDAVSAVFDAPERDAPGADGPSESGPDRAVDRAAPDAEPAPELARGLVLHFPLDEGSGTMTTDRVRALGGLLSGGPTWQSGGFPRAQFSNPFSMAFDGVDDWVHVRPPTGTLPSTDGALSISVWFNYAAVPAGRGQDLVALTNFDGSNAASGGSLQMGLANGKLTVWRWGGAAMASTSAPGPGWHHVLYTLEDSSSRLYLDGNLAATGTTAPSKVPITHLRIGAWVEGEPFKGQIDDLRLWSRALRAAEAAALFAGAQ